MEGINNFELSVSGDDHPLFIIPRARRRASHPASYKVRQKRNNDKQTPETQARQKAAVENKLYHCSICNVACRDNASHRRHNATKQHKKKIILGDNDFHCPVCDLHFRYQSAFNAHNKSKSHIKNMAKSSSSSA